MIGRRPRLVCRQRGDGVGVSTVAARSGLARELDNFLEHDLKAAFASVYGVIGAVAMQVVYDRHRVVFCGLILAPLVVLSRRLARRSIGVNASLNDQLEREVDVIEDGRPAAVSDHYRLARLEAFIRLLVAGPPADYARRLRAPSPCRQRRERGQHGVPCPTISGAATNRGAG